MIPATVTASIRDFQVPDGYYVHHPPEDKSIIYSFGVRLRAADDPEVDVFFCRADNYCREENVHIRLYGSK